MAERAPGLAPFLAALEKRLEAMDARELRTALLTHARTLGPRERDPFLALFAVAPPSEGHAARESSLPGDVAAFADRLRAGAYFDDWGWDDELHEERAWGDESWSAEMDDLFAHAADAFLAGDLGLAAEAYGGLLETLTLEEEVGAFSGPGPAQDMLATDLGEAKARLLRARYECTPPAERAAALRRHLDELEFVGPSVGLRDIAEARPGELDHVAEFLEDWIAQLWPPGGGHRRRALLTEAVFWRDGLEGLAALAREHGTQTPELFADWIDALETDAAAGACREALAALGAHGEVRARIAERLASWSAGDEQVEAHAQAWRAAPTMRRLRTLAGAAQAAGRFDLVLDGEADRVGA
ncbi:MAG: hypothetical protein M3459_01100, partial [Actinomycetota bacterium]|nr:hypothetical protein [Actinomycetota bacterium]